MKGTDYVHGWLRSQLAAFVAIALLSACSGDRTPVLPGGSGEASAIVPFQTAQHPLQSRNKARLTIHIHVPRYRRGLGSRYISRSTRGAKLVLTGTQSLTKAVALSPGANTVALSLEPGAYRASISTYDEAPVSGAIPAAAKLLSTASNLPLTIDKGKKNTANFTLDGVVASILLDLPFAYVGTAFAAKPLGVIGRDADANTIVGTYDAPIKVSYADASGHTSLTISGPDHPAAGELLSSTDTATLRYDGSNANFGATIGASSSTASLRILKTFGSTPVLTSLSVTSGKDGTAVSETLTGLFVPGATVIDIPNGGSGVVLENVSAASATQITATFFINPHTVSAGSVNVSVQSNATNNVSASKTFTISTAGVDVVTKNSDTISNAQPGICNDGASGELRHAICNAASGDTIVFDTTSMCAADTCTITLSAPLPPIVQYQTIDGGLFTGGTPRITIDGNSAYRAFWADAGTIALDNLQIQNVLAQGGAGAYAEGGGGGGAGLGGALFVNAAAVTVTNDYFLNCTAAGGAGGGAPTTGVGSGGGGGGLGGNGSGNQGLSNTQSIPGGGGGGVLGAGSAVSIGQGGNGGFGGGGGGGQEDDSGPIFTGGTGGPVYAGNTQGSGYDTINGGAGGFGGGGGGGGYGDMSAAGTGGAGGFGGGGGGGGYPLSTTGGAGANGGAGGGGGGGASGGSGGALATITGGNGTASSGYGAGGGGAAAAPAIFVNTGTLTTTNSGSSNCATSTAGAAGGSGATAGGTDTTPVYNNSGTVNGSTTTGGIASALGSSTPSLRRLPSRHRKALGGKIT